MAARGERGHQLCCRGACHPSALARRRRRRARTTVCSSSAAPRHADALDGLQYGLHAHGAHLWGARAPCRRRGAPRSVSARLQLAWLLPPRLRLQPRPGWLLCPRVRPAHLAVQPKRRVVWPGSLPPRCPPPRASPTGCCRCSGRKRCCGRSGRSAKLPRVQRVKRRAHAQPLLLHAPPPHTPSRAPPPPLPPHPRRSSRCSLQAHRASR